MTQVGIGVPRSGTHFLSAVMGWHHERFFRPGTRPWDMEYEPEVSWAAAPHVDPTNTLIFHIIRHPLKVMASNLHRDWLKPENSWGRYAHQWTKTWDYWEFYSQWFQMCEKKAHCVIKIEDISILGKPTNRYGDPAPLTFNDVPDKYKFTIESVANYYGYNL